MNEEVLRLEGIYKSFGDVDVLKDVYFTLTRGEVHALVGENGAGKSTLMKIIMGAYKPDRGKYILRGRETSFSTPSEAFREGVAMVYQEFSVLPSLTVAENVLIGRLPQKKGGLIDWEKANTAASRYLKLIGSGISPKRYVKALTVAEKQEVEIARAISYEPDILILDEPTSALSQKEIERLFEVIKNLKNSGVGVIYISHKLEEIFDIADRVTVLRDGKIVGSKKISEVKISEIIQLMTGRKIDESKGKLSEGKTAPADDEILRLEGFTIKGMFEDINMSVKKGEIVSIAGFKGAGKTELAKVLFGAFPGIKHYEGKVIINSKVINLRKYSPQHATRAGVCFVPEDRISEGIVPSMDVSFNITLPVLNKVSKAGVIIGKLVENLVTGVIRIVKLNPPDPSKIVKQLSGGNQQKLVIGKWLAADVNLLIFDEPTQGVDVGARADIYEIIKKRAIEEAGVVIFSSDLREILQVSDRILVMSKGRIKKEVLPSEVSEKQLVELLLSNEHRN